MRAARSTPLTRWVLLCFLVFSVFGTHNVVGPADHPTHAPAAVSGPMTDHTGDPAPPPPHDGHDLLEHLCLAILATAAGLALLLAVVRRRTETPAAPISRTRIGGHARPPPSSIRLATLRVLRQ